MHLARAGWGAGKHCMHDVYRAAPLPPLPARMLQPSPATGSSNSVGLLLTFSNFSSTFDDDFLFVYDQNGTRLGLYTGELPTPMSLSFPSASSLSILLASQPARAHQAPTGAAGRPGPSRRPP